MEGASEVGPALVCSRWRFVILDCPEFWAAGLKDKIEFLDDTTNGRVLSDLAILQRSRPYPVTLSFTRHSAAANGTLQPHVSRVISLHVTTQW